MKGKNPLDLLVLLATVCLLAGSAFGQTKTEKNAYLVEINSAPKFELMTLPGIGDADAQKIIDGRPYRAKTELLQKNIIPQATYDKIADSITAKRSRPQRRRPARYTTLAAGKDEPYCPPAENCSSSRRASAMDAKKK